MASGYTLRFDLDTLIKADVSELYGALLRGRQGGWLSANDCREETGWPRVAGGDSIEPPVSGGKPAGEDSPPIAHKAEIGAGHFSDDAIAANIDDISAVVLARFLLDRERFAAKFPWLADAIARLQRGVPGVKLDGQPVRVRRMVWYI